MTRYIGRQEVRQLAFAELQRFHYFVEEGLARACKTYVSGLDEAMLTYFAIELAIALRQT